MKMGLFKPLRSYWSYFMLGSALMVSIILGLHYYSESQAYVVMLGEEKLGIVEDARQLEGFVEDLTKRCSELYGMDLIFAEKIVLVKDFMPDSEPDPDLVEKKIRHQASFLTDAFLIKVDGEPFVPVASQMALNEVVDSLKEEYISGDQSATILDVVLLEDIVLEECTIPLEDLHTTEEVVALLKESSNESILQVAAAVEPILRSSLVSRYSSARDYTLNPEINAEVENLEVRSDKPEVNGIKVHVKTVEEITVIESIPFPVEELFDEKMLISESEITTPGQDGEKSVIYQIVRENGVEIERIVISEEILLEPTAQVETKGLREPPAVGTGQFVWPVRGEGIIYNGYSARHTGIDIHIDHGTDVLAADSGIVTYSGYGGTQGNYLIVYHGAYWTLYLHNSEHFVSQGDRVSRGQVIAKVGTTGRAFGAHLHFEVRRDDGTGKWHSYYQHTAVNPMQFFNRR